MCCCAPPPASRVWAGTQADHVNERAITSAVAANVEVGHSREPDRGRTLAGALRSSWPSLAEKACLQPPLPLAMSRAQL